LALETQLSKCGFMPPAAGTSDIAKRRKDESQHREKLAALQKQLDTTNKRLKECNISRNQYVVDIEHKERAFRALETRCNELQQDKHKLAAQLEAVSAGAAGGQGGPVRTPAGLRARVQALSEQLTLARAELARKEGELGDAALRTSVLEGALDFRAEEVGLAGHADMLCKMAGFREQVAALKSDLLDKRNRLHDMQAERQSVRRESDLSLRGQVEELQERLARSRFALQRGQRGESLSAQLSQAEAERDLVLEYIQTDLRSSSELTLAADKASKDASEARRALESAQRQLRSEAERAEGMAARIGDLEGRQAALAAEGAAARAGAGSGLLETEDLRARLCRKEAEYQELLDVHDSLLQQLKAKEAQALSLAAEAAAARGQAEGAGGTLARLEGERRDLAAQAERLCAELVPLREAALASSATSLRPELESLQADYAAVQSERRALLEEAQRLRYYDQQVQELRAEIVRAKPPAAPDPALNSALGLGLGAGPGPASRGHATWTCIPALRQVSPVLSDNVREMLQDLVDQEAESEELRAELLRCRTEQTHRQEDQESDSYRLAERDARAARREAECQARLAASGRASLVVGQVRRALRTALGDTVFDYAPRPPPAGGGGHSPVARGSAGPSGRQGPPSGSSRSPAGSPQQQPFRGQFQPQPPFRGTASVGPGALRDPLEEDDLQRQAGGAGRPYDLDDNGGGSFDASLEAIVGSGGGDELDGISDESLPSIISRALGRHMSAVSSLGLCERQLEEAEAEVDRLGAQLARAGAEGRGLRQTLAASQESAETRHASLTERLRAAEGELVSAVSLVEKQNDLSISLEAKVEELKRQLSVKAAQFISAQQQEEVFKYEIINIFGNFWRSVLSQHGPLGVSRGNWFMRADAAADASDASSIVQATGEILSAVSYRMDQGSPSGQGQGQGQPPSPRGGGTTPPAHSPPPDVSHHFRQSRHSQPQPQFRGGGGGGGGAKQEYADAEAGAQGSLGEGEAGRLTSGLGTSGSASKLARSLSQPFTREEFRQFGGSKSFSQAAADGGGAGGGAGGGTRRQDFGSSPSPQRPSLLRGSTGNASRDNLVNNSAILSRLKKAKTAYNFIRNDSLS
jgi:hypothetical protein